MDTGAARVELKCPWGQFPERTQGDGVQLENGMMMVQFTDDWGTPTVMRVPNHVLEPIRTVNFIRN